MSKNRVKLVIWLILVAVTLVAVLLVIQGMGRIVTFFSSGADPESALNIVPAVPVDLDERVVWLPDHPDAAAGRAIDPYTRDQVAGGYLSAWAQLNISHQLEYPYNLKTYFSGQARDQANLAIAQTMDDGWSLEQSNLHHALELAFYSDDGSIVSFTDHDARFVRLLKQEETGDVLVREDTSAWDVIMMLEDGNWRVRFLVRRGEGNGAFAAMLSELRNDPDAAQPIAPSRFVGLENGALTLDGQPFTVAGTNYYPRNTPWTRFWEEYDPARTKVDLQVMRGLDLNSVRIFVPFDDFGADEVDPVRLALLTDFLDQAALAQIKVIVTLFDHRTDHHPSNWSADDRHLAGLIPPLADHPALLAWDLKNEADRDYDYNSPELTEAWLRHMADTLRRLDSNHLLTIGWSSPEAATALTETVDIVAYHYFAPAAEYRSRVGALQAAAPDKPLLLEEFGLPTWNTILPNGHTEAEQAVYYAELLARHREINTAGYVNWTLYDFTNIPLGEFLLPWQRGPQAHMGVIRRDYTFKPAAALLAPDASLMVPAVPGYARFLKPFWIMLAAVGGLSFVLVIVLLFFLLRRRRTHRSRS